MNILEKWIEDNKDDPEFNYEVTFLRNNKHWHDRWIAGGVTFCKHCGAPVYDNATNDRQQDKEACGTCNFWIERLEKPRPPSVCIINRGWYSDGGKKPHGEKFLGFGGSVFHIYDYGRGKVFWTNNLWSGGTIPLRFEIGDTASFITEKSSDDELDFVEAFMDLPKETKEHIAKVRKYKASKNNPFQGEDK